MKQNPLSTYKNKELDGNKGNRCNVSQVYKVREYIRKSRYLKQSKQCKTNFSLDRKTALAQYLVHFTTAENKIGQYVNERALKKDITIKPVYVTHEEAEQETSLFNTSKMMEQGYNRNVKNRKKD